MIGGTWYEAKLIMLIVGTPLLRMTPVATKEMLNPILRFSITRLYTQKRTNVLFWIGVDMPSREFGGKWSLEKLNCVSRYLKSFLLVMTNQPWARELWYIDAFSGEGIQHLKPSRQPTESLADEESIAQFTLGSALRAIEVSIAREREGGRGFDHFAFIELDRDKLRLLESRVAEVYPEYLQRCQFIQGDVNEMLPKLLNSIDWSMARGVAFVDPFATEMQWKSICSFKNTCCDFWVLFPLHAIIRMLPTGHMPDEAWSRRLDLVFGSEDWRELYSPKKQMSLFGDEGSYERNSGIGELLDYASERFKSAFPGVWGPAVLRTETNSPLFALYAIVPNGSEKALKASGDIARHLIRQFDA